METSPEQEVLRSMRVVEEELDARIEIVDMQNTKYNEVLRYLRYINSRREQEMKEEEAREREKASQEQAAKKEMKSRGSSVPGKNVEKEVTRKGFRDSKEILSSSLQSLSEEEEEREPEVRRSLEKIQKEAQDSLPSYLDDLLAVARKARAPSTPSSSSRAIEERKAKIKNTCTSEMERKGSGGANRAISGRKNTGRQNVSTHTKPSRSSTYNRGKVNLSAQSKQSSSSSSTREAKRIQSFKKVDAKGENLHQKERKTKIEEDRATPPSEPTYKELVQDFFKQVRRIEAFYNSELFCSFCAIDKETLVDQSKTLTYILNGFDGGDDVDYNKEDSDEDEINVDEIINPDAHKKEEKRKRLTLINTSMDWLYKSIDLKLKNRYIYYETQPGDDFPFQKAIQGAEELSRMLLVSREHYERVLQPRIRRIPFTEWTKKDAEEISAHWMRLRLLYGIYQNTVLQVVSNEAAQCRQEDGTKKDPASMRPLHMRALACIQNLPATFVHDELTPLTMEEVGDPDWLPSRRKAIKKFHETLEACVDLHNESLISKYLLKDRLRKLKELCDQNKDKRTAEQMSEEELGRWRETLKDCQLLYTMLVSSHRKKGHKSSKQKESEGDGKPHNQMYFFEKTIDEASGMN